MSTRTNVIELARRRNACLTCPLGAECLARDVDELDGDSGAVIDPVPRVLHGGEHCYREGDAFDAVFMVRCGTVKSYVLSPDGDEQVIGFHAPGDLLGLDAMDASAHVTSAVSLDTTSVCRLPFDRLCRLSAISPVVNRRFLSKVGQRIREDEARLLMLGQRSADQRIAAFLLALTGKRAARGFAADEIMLAMPRADIASYLALAVETVSRVLTRMQDAGVLEVARSHIAILEPEKLRALAGSNHAASPAAAIRAH